VLASACSPSLTFPAYSLSPPPPLAFPTLLAAAAAAAAADQPKPGAASALDE